MNLNTFVLLIGCIFTLFYNYACEDIFGCGGFVKSNFSINYARVEIKLYTKQGSLKYQTDCAPNNGYYLIPLYDKGDYVLKIEPPNGWSFEPNSVTLHVDGVTDPCSRNQDINFIFKGFAISGKVLSYGQNVGPSKIKLDLKKPSGEVLQETSSDIGGSYSFSSVLPGDYVIEASHDTWQFTDRVEEIKVDKDNVQAQNNIVIAGFDVKGYVFSEGEPIQGVHFLLFSLNKVKRIPQGCIKDRVRTFNYNNYNKDLHYLCHVTSKTDGSFLFPSLPTGQYKLIPFHKGEHIEFDVSPSEVDFEVKQDSYEFPEDFQVEGFSVIGRVLEGENGTGIEGAEMFINEKRHTVTGKNGIYHLENMRAGTYRLKVKMPHIFFDDVPVRVTPNTPHLPAIYASKFSICGHIHIDNYPGDVSDTRILKIKSQEGDFHSDIPVQEDGTFCTVSSPGVYILEPVVTEEEKLRGLQLDPPQHKVHLSNYPLLDVTFTQFLATLRGHVMCIGKCGELHVKIVSLTNEDIAIETTTSDNGKFEIASCLPGKYILTVEKDDWCFQTKKLEFEITQKQIPELVLKQSGFQATVRLSHESSFKIKYPSGETHSMQLQKAKNVLCLPELGIYDLIPIGCHLYKSDSFKLDTSKPSELDILPAKHLVTGNVFTEVNVSDIKVFIQKQVSPNPEIISLNEPVELKNGKFRYEFSVFVEPNNELEVKVTSTQLLFRPPVARIPVLDECIDGAVEIIGKKGLFIIGAVTPALEGVKMTVLDKKSKLKLADILTDENGKFTVGPLDDENEYEVTAEKEGYFFTSLGSIGKFQAFKLAGIVVEVQSEDGTALSGVLLSLSGGVDYRKNSLTQKNGKVSFLGLNPGQYFLRPMLKEYQFQPPTKMIDIKEGSQMTVKISGKRVAYSLYGVVNSLTGEAEVGLAVEAVGIESDICRQYQEEAISEQGGIFRIRGLQPGCQYSLRLKKGSDVNQHIERATPEETIVKVTDGDIKDVRIIAFRQFGQMDVSGSIITKEDYLPTLKVRLYCEDNPEQVLHTITLGRSGFFFLPSMPIDKRMYTLRLDSSLSSSAFQYDSPSVTFCANTSFHHFTLHFHPQPKSQEQEVTQGSIFALPLAVIVILIVYYYDKFLIIAMQVWQTVTNIASPSRSTLSADSILNDAVTVRRKAKARRAL